jgi:disulfide oxidoreductase YuzD
LQRSYPDRVRVSYYDAARPEVQEQFAGVIEQAKSRYWPYPLVLVNGDITMAGDVNTYAISRLVGETLNQKQR